MPAFPPPPSPFPPPSPPMTDTMVTSFHSDGHGGAPSLIIIVGIIAFVIAASASIHLLLRVISRNRSSSSSFSSSSPSPTPFLRTIPISEPSPVVSDRDLLIASLPLFNLASSVSTFKKSQSLDCAVCLSNFRSHDELRLLPSCRHAFHAQCVDTWLRSTPSCPLCRASIDLPPLQHPTSSNLPRSGSFRVELGSVSRRTPSAEGIPTGHARSYSLGSSFEYLVDEEVEAVLDRLRRIPDEKPENGGDAGGGALRVRAPGLDLADSAAGNGRGWLRECIDRMTSSASSSFNSLRFSGRINSHRFNPPTAIVSGGANRSWDLEANNFAEWEDSGFGMFYRWLIGV